MYGGNYELQSGMLRGEKQTPRAGGPRDICAASLPVQVKLTGDSFKGSIISEFGYKRGHLVSFRLVTRKKGND
jgi:hypothetical protein